PGSLTITTHDNSPEGGTVYDRDGIKVAAFLVDHGHVKPAYGYRVDYGGRAVVLSGDTTYSPNLISHAKNVNLLIHSVAIGRRLPPRSSNTSITISQVQRWRDAS